MLAMSTKSADGVPVSPIRLLIGDYHLRLLALLLLRPGEDFYLRQIARLTGVPVGPARRELERFVKAGLIHRRRVGNQVRYEADRTNPVFPELRRLLQKTVGLADVLREALEPLASRIELAFVFGSVARGEEGPRSDIDLMVVGDVGFQEVVGTLFPLHERLGREINPVVMKPEEFQRRKKENSFIERVMNGDKLLLMGTLDEPGEP